MWHQLCTRCDAEQTQILMPASKHFSQKFCFLAVWPSCPFNHIMSQILLEKDSPAKHMFLKPFSSLLKALLFFRKQSHKKFIWKFKKCHGNHCIQWFFFPSFVFLSSYHARIYICWGSCSTHPLHFLLATIFFFSRNYPGPSGGLAISLSFSYLCLHFPNSQSTGLYQ